MPEISVWPVSSLVRTWKVGSSSARRPSAVDIFSWSAFVFGSIATLITGSGKVIVSSLIGLSGAASVSPGDDLLDPHAGGDVARVDLLDLFALVGVHHQDAADPLGASGVHVEHAGARIQLAGVDAEVGELADVGVGHDLVHERSERLLVGGVAHRGLSVAVVRGLDRLDPLDRRHIERARQVVDDRVEQRLHALVLEARTAQHGGQRDLERGLADRRLELLDRDLLLLQDHLQQLVVVVRDLLEQVLAGGGGLRRRARPGSSITSCSLPSSSL